MRLIEKLYFAACFVCMFAMSANAYIDPSVATYAIQAIAGVAVAVGAVAGIMIRKLKRTLHEKLGIDENSNKEVEPNIVVYYETVL